MNDCGVRLNENWTVGYPRSEPIRRIRHAKTAEAPAC